MFCFAMFYKELYHQARMPTHNWSTQSKNKNKRIITLDLRAGTDTLGKKLVVNLFYLPTICPRLRSCKNTQIDYFAK